MTDKKVTVNLATHALGAHILGIIQGCRYPLAMMQICRRVNERWKGYCVRKTCYVNPRQRKIYRVTTPDCQTRYHKVSRVLRGLERQGHITITRERKADNKNHRGWDWMNVVRMNYTEAKPR